MRTRYCALILLLGACSQPDSRCTVEFTISDVIRLADQTVQVTASWATEPHGKPVFLQGVAVGANGSSQLTLRGGDNVRLAIGDGDSCIEERSVVVSDDTPILLPRIRGIVRGYQSAADASVLINDVLVLTDRDGGFELTDVRAPYFLKIGSERYEGIRAEYVELHAETAPVAPGVANSVVNIQFTGRLPPGDEINWSASSGTQKIAGASSVLPFLATEFIDADREVLVVATQEDAQSGSVLTRSIVSAIAGRDTGTSEFAAAIDIPSTGGRTVSVATECPCGADLRPFMFFGVYNPDTMLEYRAAVPSEIASTMQFPKNVGLPLYVERTFTDVDDADLRAGYVLRIPVQEGQTSVSLSRPTTDRSCLRRHHEARLHRLGRHGSLFSRVQRRRPRRKNSNDASDNRHSRVAFIRRSAEPRNVTPDCNMLHRQECGLVTQQPDFQAV